MRYVVDLRSAEGENSLNFASTRAFFPHEQSFGLGYRPAQMKMALPKAKHEVKTGRCDSGVKDSERERRSALSFPAMNKPLTLNFLQTCILSVSLYEEQRHVISRSHGACFYWLW